MKNAWVVCWSWDESRVQIRPELADVSPLRAPPIGQRSPGVWVDVKYDAAAKRLWCEHRGEAFHLEFV